MGTQQVRQVMLQDVAALRRFSRQLIQDVRALERMLREEMFETGIRRIGAEQELFLVDERGQPAPIIEQVLAQTTDRRVVTELAQFNLEFNLDPCVFGENCLRHTEQQLNEMLGYVRGLVQGVGGEVVLVGILPTIHISDLTLDNMTQRPRYRALNDVLSYLRGGMVQLQIRGVDELFVRHDNIMVEGCNASFQIHFQVNSEEFPRFYNIAQAIAGPCMAVAANAPLLFGKRLWQETRIAVFQQAVDTRSSNLYLREMSPRVHFGTGWVQDSITEIFTEDIARFQVLLAAEDEVENAMDLVEAGRVPRLKALQVHNSTVYRWNRACYGITNGVPHLRIENRILPSGPTPADEVANAAFWFGLVSGLAEEYGDITEVMDFDAAKSNFMAAARRGLASQLVWEGGKSIPAHDLICDRLMPVARKGLLAAGIDRDDVDHYLGILEKRVETGRTGAEWQLASLAHMKGQGSRADRLYALVGAMINRQRDGQPVHTWDLAELDEAPGPGRLSSTRVEDLMSTDLLTVHEDELVEFVAWLMDWRRVRHMLVEDGKQHLVGIVSGRAVMRFLADASLDDRHTVPIKEIMIRDPITISPEKKSAEAIRCMREHRIGALPVVRHGHLVGIITERDFLNIAGALLDQSMEEEEG